MPCKADSLPSCLSKLPSSLPFCHTHTSSPPEPLHFSIIQIIQNTHPSHHANGNIDLPFSRSFRLGKWLGTNVRAAVFHLIFTVEHRFKRSPVISDGRAGYMRIHSSSTLPGDVNTFVLFSFLTRQRVFSSFFSFFWVKFGNYAHTITACFLFVLNFCV